MRDRELLFGVTGSVAAYKAPELVSRCVQLGARATVVLSRSALHFVGPATFEALTGRPAYVEMFEPREHFLGEHIGLARRAELYCIAPVTAHTLARLAHGLADDLLTCLALAFSGPILLAPAMNPTMWRKPAVQRNVRQLHADGYRIIEPEPGWVSCREEGTGRMAEPDRIVQAIERLLNGGAAGE